MENISNIADRFKERAKDLTSNRPLTPTPAELSPRPADSCPDCRGTGFIGYDVPVGHPKFGKVEPCPSPFHGPERLKRMAALSGLSEADLNKRLYDITPVEGNHEMIIAANEFVLDPFGWLFIWGGPGNAKSEVLIALVNEINLANKGPAMYCTFADLVNWVREAFKDNASEDYTRRFDKLLSLKVIAIDEMDKARDTEFSNEFRFHFLDKRYRQAIDGKSCLVFASNSHPNTLPEPLYDRVRDGRFKTVQNKAGSARPNMRRG